MMKVRTRLVVGLASVTAAALLLLSFRAPMAGWDLLALYVVLGMLSACFKVRLPGGDAALSFNVPYILLAIVWLPLPQALMVGAASALVICTFRVSPPNSPVQIMLNVANVINATGCAWLINSLVMHFSRQPLPALVLASLGYFLVNSTTIAAVLASLEGRPIFRTWRELFLWSLPFYPVGALLAAVAYGVEVRFGQLTAQTVLPMVYVIYMVCRGYVGRLQERHKHAADMAALHLRTIEALALAIEAKDRNTHDHLCRVRVYADGIAAELHLTQDEREALIAAALLHDIGKLAVPEHIINKPGKLNREEFETMKIHPVVGAEILDRVCFPYPVSPIVRSHHEQWNGSGYPDGLIGEAIPIGARILSAVDCFDALASDRPYRRALPLQEAMAHVEGLAGIQFDPRVVRVLSRRYEELEVKAREESKKMMPLQQDIVVRRGEAPSAGFETSAPSPAEMGNAFESSRVVAFETRVLAEVGHLLANAFDLEESLAPVAAKLQTLIPFDVLIVLLSDGNVLTPRFVAGTVGAQLRLVEIPVGQGLCGWVARTRQVILNGNPSVDTELFLADARMAEMRSALALPLIGGEGNLAGVVALYKKKQDGFGTGHVRLLQSVQPKLAHAIEQILLRQRDGASMQDNARAAALAHIG